jgi:ankyrin repeat protein
MNSIDEELFEGTRENNVPEVRWLSSNGADVNAKDRHGGTPLTGASYRGHSQVVKELLDHGANIEATTRFGDSPLYLACNQGHLAVVNELLSPNDSNGATTTILGKRKSGGANI